MICDVAIIGGGPAGSTAAIYLAKNNFNVCLFEKKSFPRETLCGEFLSHEVSEILSHLNIFEKFLELKPNLINRLSLNFPNKNKISTPLGFEAFGLKRSVFDNFLLQEAKEKQVQIFQPAKVLSVNRTNGVYSIAYSESNSTKIIYAKNVIAAFGKQSNLASQFNRQKPNSKKEFLGVKFHLNSRYLKIKKTDEINIYLRNNFYCGLNFVAENEAVVCFLVNRSKYKKTVETYLRKIFFESGDFENPFEYDLIDRIPHLKFIGVDNLSFGRKQIIENGIFMIGDSAGQIAPLTGNGIAIAMQSAFIISALLKKHREEKASKKSVEMLYENHWLKEFNKRIKIANVIQTIALNSKMSRLLIKFNIVNRTLINFLIKQTRSLRKANNLLNSYF